MRKLKITKSRKAISVNIVIDESGSMFSRTRQVISGVNEYLDSLLHKDDVDYYVNIVKFSGNSKVIVENKPIAEVGEFSSYSPDGGTALIDAVADAIKATDRDVEKNKYETAIFLILTDGEENSSRRHKSSEVKSMIEKRQAKGWVFTYMGADANSWDAADSIGISQANTVVWNAQDFSGLMRASSIATTSYCSSFAAGANVNNVDYYKSAGIDDLNDLAKKLK